MGWSGGTEIFDTVARELLEIIDAEDVCLPNSKVLNLLSSLKAVLEDQDWDSHSESDYWDQGKIGEILSYTDEEEE